MRKIHEQAVHAKNVKNINVHIKTLPKDKSIPNT